MTNPPPGSLAAATAAATASPSASSIPITILTGFLGSGKTTLLLSLLPQLPANYKLCLLKNEFGSVATDSLLASQTSISGVTELLNGCICCNLVGQLKPALQSLLTEFSPSRIVIETSGSAFPATLALEVKRLSQGGLGIHLDGVVQVVDCQNWRGYEDTSYTAKMQARYTDLVVINKHHLCTPEVIDSVIDRIRDVSDDVAIVRASEQGSVPADVIFGVDSRLAASLLSDDDAPAHDDSHSSEVEVLSVRLLGSGQDYVDAGKLSELLNKAPKDEVYRIKGLIRLRSTPPDAQAGDAVDSRQWILNWAFGRWTWTALKEGRVSTTIESPARLGPEPEEREVEPEPEPEPEGVNGFAFQHAMQRKGSIEVVVQTRIESSVVEEKAAAARMSVIVARGEGERWRRRIDQEGWVRVEGDGERAEVKRAG